MNFFKWITGGANSADKVIDGIVKTGDALFFTSEEKSDFDLKRQDLWLELQKTLANESTPRSINRRIVAWSVIFMSIILTVTCIVFKFFGMDELARYTQETAIGFKWDWAFCGVIVFYFGTHMMSALRK